MRPLTTRPAKIERRSAQELILTGAWTMRGLESERLLTNALATPDQGQVLLDCSGIEALDSAGAWLLQKFIQQLRTERAIVQLGKLLPAFAQLLEVAATEIADQAATPPSPPAAAPSGLARLGQATQAMLDQATDILSFVGEVFIALLGCIRHPSRFRWRPILFNIRTAGFDALPIVGLIAFLLGIVVAYQGADQLRQYGANIFVVDLVGLSMLREFAPLITAIIIAGRSGSAFAAQIGTMAVTEEIDAMRTLGIAPLELLVLPKIIALLVALPLLTVFADFLGVLGGMIMAKTQLGVGYGEFLERFTKAVSVTAYLIGIAKAPVFAIIITVVGCFQGFRTKGGADSVGRQTTRSVVQSIFLVIVADALFSIAFSALDL